MNPGIGNAVLDFFSGSPELAELRTLSRKSLSNIPKLAVTQFDLEDNQLFREFRSGDLKAEDWRRPPFLERTLRQIGEFFYY